MRALYQLPSLSISSAAASAASANHAIERWPSGSTTAAASSGPTADPPLPPTWNIDCARLFLPPDASCATREAVGWNTDDPRPTMPTASNISA